MDEITVGIYVPSYKRADQIITWDTLDHNCTYVVRDSEREAYEKAGITKILSAPDEEINSAQKVRYWILDNTPEDIIIQIDDDVKEFRLCSSVSEKLPVDAVMDELYRVSQVMYDLGIGYGGTRNTAAPWNYTSEIAFTGVCGTLTFFNKAKFKAKPDPIASFAEDTDRALQELLVNRIIFVPLYMSTVHDMDYAPGGDSDNKTGNKLNAARNYLSQKWGRYYNYVPESNKSQIKVKR